MDLPSGAQHELGHDPNPNEMHVRDGIAGGDTWTRHVSGVASEDLAGIARQARHAVPRGHRRDDRRGAATDPDIAGEGVPFAFQLDDRRSPPVGDPPLSSSLDWMAGEVVDDVEGVHKRSLNGTSKGVSPTPGVSVSAGTVSPRDEGDLIHRDSPGAMQQQLPKVILFAYRHEFLVLSPRTQK